jgi:hypothetical protein
MNVGSSVSILSVGTVTVCAYALGRLLGGFAAWPVGAFVATSAYLLLFGVELGLYERFQRARRSSDPGGYDYVPFRSAGFGWPTRTHFRERPFHAVG